MTNSTNIALGIFAGGLLLFGAYSCVQRGNKASDIVDELDRETAVRDVLNPMFKGWKYSVDVDEMRETTTKRAELLANNYHAELTPKLSVFLDQNGNRNAMLSGAISSIGGIRCKRGGIVSVKADAKKIQDIECQQGINLALEPSFYDIVASSEKIVIEVETDLGSTRQFTFETKGFKFPETVK